MLGVGKDKNDKAKQAKTKVKMKSVNPEWNETIVFMVTDVSEDLRVSIWNYDMLQENEEIGHVTLALGDLAAIDEKVRSI